jgi:hypothetical protein
MNDSYDQDPINLTEHLMQALFPVRATQPVNHRLESAKQYLREHGISQPRVKIGGLYTRPMIMQPEITKEMSVLQEALLNVRRS